MKHNTDYQFKNSRLPRRIGPLTELAIRFSSLPIAFGSAFLSFGTMGAVGILHKVFSDNPVANQIKVNGKVAIETTSNWVLLPFALIPLIFLGLGLLLFVGGLFEGRQYVRLVRSGFLARAKSSGFEVHYGGKSGKTPTYTHTMCFDDHKGNSIEFETEGLHEQIRGAEEVVYDPDKPREAVLLKSIHGLKRIDELNCIHGRVLRCITIWIFFLPFTISPLLITYMVLGSPDADVAPSPSTPPAGTMESTTDSQPKE